VTPLRKRFIEDLKLRNYAPGTIQNYVYHVARWTRYHGRSPEQLGQEAVRRYFLHLIEKGEISWSHYNVAVCALRFFYRTTLGEKWPIQHTLRQAAQKAPRRPKSPVCHRASRVA
jgi:integrase/recombinase XerD